MSKRSPKEMQELVFNFVKTHKNYFIFGLLAVIIAISAYIRYLPIPNLIDITTGKYISLELDSTIFLKYARIIAETGSLPLIDTMRNVPLGVNVANIGIFTSYFIAYLYQFLHIFIPSITIEYVDII